MEISTEDKYRTIKKIAIIAFLFIVSLAVYYNSFKGEFISLDDWSMVVENSKLADITNLKAIWSDYSNRVLVDLTFAMNIKFAKYEMFWYHLVNYCIHFINGLLVFGILKFILSLEYFEKRFVAKKKEWFAGALAALFLIHPLTTAAVTYIYQRFALVAAMFYFIAVFSYLSYRSKGKKRYYIISIIATFLAIFSKENTFSIPFMLFFLDLLCFSSITKENAKNTIKKVIVNLIPYAVVLLFAVLLQFKFGHNRSVFDNFLLVPNNITTYFFTQQNVVMNYICLLFLPINQVFDYELSYPFSRTLWENFAWLNFLIYSILIFFAVYYSKAKRLYSISIMWFAIALSVESSVVVLREVYFEHRVYLALPAFLLFLLFVADSILGEDIKWRRKSVYYVAAVFFAATLSFSYLTITRNELFRHESLLWLDTVKKAPDNARANLLLSNALIEAYIKDRNPATLDLADSVNVKGAREDKIDNKNKKIVIINNMRIRYFHGHYEEIIETTQEYFKPGNTVLLNDFYSYIFLYRGKAFMELGKFDKAKESLEIALKSKITELEARANLDQILKITNK